MVVYKLYTSVNDYKYTDQTPYVVCLENHHISNIEKNYVDLQTNY